MWFEEAVEWEDRPELHTCRATTDDDHVEEAVNFLGALTGETSGLDAYRRGFSMLRRAKLFPRTVEETVLHLDGLSTRGLQRTSKKYHLFRVL